MTSLPPGWRPAVTLATRPWQAHQWTSERSWGFPWLSLSEGGKSFSHSPQRSSPQSHRPEPGHIPIPKPIGGQAHGMILGWAGSSPEVSSCNGADTHGLTLLEWHRCRMIQIILKAHSTVVPSQGPAASGGEVRAQPRSLIFVSEAAWFLSQLLCIRVPLRMWLAALLPRKIWFNDLTTSETITNY